LKNLWNEIDATQYKSDLDLRVYTSKLLGKESSLVLHGGGNTSVKIIETNLIGFEEDILYVMSFLASDKFDARRDCATLCFQDKVNEALNDLVENDIKLADVSNNAIPQHVNFI